MTIKFEKLLCSKSCAYIYIYIYICIYKPINFKRKAISWHLRSRSRSSSSSSSFEGHPLQVRHKQDWGRGFIFYYPILLHCMNQMLAVVLLSQHRVSSSKTVRPRAPCGARCIGHAVRHGLRFAQRRRTRNSVKERDPICAWTNGIARRRLSLIQAARGKPIPTGLTPVRGRKAGSLKHFYSTPRSICDLSIQKRGCQIWQGCPRDSAHLAQTGIWILVSLGEYLRTHLTDHTRYDRGPEIHGSPRRVSLPFGEAQLAGCMRVQVGGPLEWDAGIQ